MAFVDKLHVLTGFLPYGNSVFQEEEEEQGNEEDEVHVSNDNTFL